MTAEADTRIDLLRHGEPVGGTRYRGQKDDPLSERGWQQMRRAVANESGWQQIVTSPLLRCRAFATELGRQRRVPVRCDERFREIGFGEWEGRTRTELEEIQPGQVLRFYEDPVANRPPGAEPLEAFSRRVREGFEELLESLDGHHILVVAHAGVIRAIISQVLAIPLTGMYRIQVPNAGISRIRTDRLRGFCLLSHGG